MSLLADALAAAELSEYAVTLHAKLEPLRLAATAGPKPLMDWLKVEAGVSKLGHRQKLAKSLLEVLDGNSSALPAAADFWASLASERDEVLSFGDLSALVVTVNPVLYAPPRTAPNVRVIETDQLRQMRPGDGAVSLEKRAAAYEASGGGGANAAQTAEQFAAYRERGKVAFDRRDYAAASRWYEKALAVPLESIPTTSLHEDHATVLNNLAACALAANPPDPTAALLRLKPLLEAIPRHSKALVRAGRCCIMLGELQAALIHYGTALHVERDAASAISGNAPVRLAYAEPRAASDERLKIMGPDGKTPLSYVAQQAADGKAHATRLISHGERCHALAAKGRVNEAVYLGACSTRPRLGADATAADAVRHTLCRQAG